MHKEEEKEQLLIEINELDKLKHRKLWYFDHQGKEFPVSLITKRGYVVFRDDVEGNQMWLVKKSHCNEVN